MGNAANAGFEILNEKNRVWAVNSDEGKSLNGSILFNILLENCGRLGQASCLAANKGRTA